MSIIRSVVIGRMLAALACILVAGKLAFIGKDGWGWFLFSAVILGSVTASSSDEKAESDL